jgi:hypothetical protein
MSRFHINLRKFPVAALRIAVVGFALVLSACVAPIPIKDQAPKVDYQSSSKVTVAVIDARTVLKEDKKSPTYIGRVHGLFGIPTDMHVYPWVALKDEKQLTLAQELDQRIVDGLQAAGATVVPIAPGANADTASARHAAEALGVDRILLITLDTWEVNVNLNWVGSFDFDWGYTVEIDDKNGDQISMFKDSGHDEIKESASDSPRNMITVAWRDRLTKLLDRPELRSGLSLSSSTQLSSGGAAPTPSSNQTPSQ